MVRFKEYTKQRTYYWGNSMAERTIYTCDVCGKDMPEDGAVMIIQHSITLKEKGWDLCDRCHKRILTYIHDITKEE